MKLSSFLFLLGAVCLVAYTASADSKVDENDDDLEDAQIEKVLKSLEDADEDESRFLKDHGDAQNEKVLKSVEDADEDEDSTPESKRIYRRTRYGRRYRNRKYGRRSYGRGRRYGYGVGRRYRYGRRYGTRYYG